MEKFEQFIEDAKLKLKHLREHFRWLEKEEVASLLDHTLLKPYATLEELRRFLLEGSKYNFASYCVNSFAIPYLKNLADQNGLNIKLCSVVGFPLGAMDKKAKAFEAVRAIENGASEIDMVMNIGLLKSGEFKEVRSDIEAVREEIGKDIVLKVIIETAYLTNEEKVYATELVMDAGADFVKTSTGFGPGGATAFDVALLSVVSDGKIKVKAAGGIRNYYTVCAYYALGARRIGASSSIKIMEEI